MTNLDKVVYLSEAQKETLFTNGSITVDGRTIEYSDNDLYVTPSAIDTTPAQGSSNLITSGAVYNAIEDITYENKNAVSSGTDVSLVTTGDKYNWNNKQAKITASGILKGDGSGGVSAATAGIDYAALSFTITLDDASWSNNTQTINNQNFLASGYSYIVAPASASFEDYATAVIYADNVTTDGNMTFHCARLPVSDLTVNIMRMVSL